MYIAIIFLFHLKVYTCFLFIISKVNLAMDSSSLGLLFQIVTMNVTGKVIIWVVAELGQPDPHGSITDLGRYKMAALSPSNHTLMFSLHSKD